MNIENIIDFRIRFCIICDLELFFAIMKLINLRIKCCSCIRKINRTMINIERRSRIMIEQMVFRHLKTRKRVRIDRSNFDSGIGHRSLNCNGFFCGCKISWFPIVSQRIIPCICKI